MAQLFGASWLADVPDASAFHSTHAFSTSARTEEPIDLSFLLLAPVTTPASSPLSLLTDDSLDSVSVAPSFHWQADRSDESTVNSASTESLFWQESVRPLSPITPEARPPSHSPTATSPRSRRGHSSSASSALGSNSSGKQQATIRPAQRTVASKKRRRVNSVLDADERMERRRAQHRAVDANRRQKENEAIVQLHGLIRHLKQQHGEVYDAAELRSALADEEESESVQPGASRLGVLQSSITLIGQLTSACKRMDEACTAKDAQVSRVSAELQGMAATIAQQATTLALVQPSDGHTAKDFRSSTQSPEMLSRDASQPWQPWQPSSAARPVALSPSDSTLVSAPPSSMLSYLRSANLSPAMQLSTASLLSTMCVCVVTLPVLVVVDVNERFLAASGYARTDIAHLSFNDSPLCRGVNQHPAALMALSSVAAGSTRQGSGVWRFRKADRLLYEVTISFFALFSEVLADGIVDERRLPDRMLILGTPGGAVLVDREHAAGVM